MRIINTEHKFCACCMKEHDVHVVEVETSSVFKGVETEYKAVYEYCENTDEYWAVSGMINENDINFKNAYREKTGLLTTNQIAEIRKRYGITQKDLALILGWGEKTITRYEGHQVQDAAHDEIIRKIDCDPEWFLELLDKGKDRIVITSYRKYRENILKRFEFMQDYYLRKSILAKYANYLSVPEYCGNSSLDFDKIVQMVNYFANSTRVKSLYKVKLMKMLWYADALSYKRYGHAISGMVYYSKPMGALPLAHEQIVELKGIAYEELYYEDGIGLKFSGNTGCEYDLLTESDIKVLDTIIECFGGCKSSQIVELMHREDAYCKTDKGNIISFIYSKTLSLE